MGSQEVTETPKFVAPIAITVNEPEMIRAEDLEKTVLSILQDKQFIPKRHDHIIYKLPDTAGPYRRARSAAIRHSGKIFLAGLALAALTYQFAPSAAAVLGSVGAVAGLGGKVIAPLDRILWNNESEAARRAFQNLALPWDAYEHVNPESIGELNTLVQMSQVPNAVRDVFKTTSHQVALGITIAKTADILADFNYNKKTGRVSKGDLSLSGRELLKMVFAQKIKDQSTTDQIRDMRQSKSMSEIIRLLNTKDAATVHRRYRNAIDTIRDIMLNGPNFLLEIDEAGKADSVGTQLSRGYVVSRNAVGPHAASYMGKHSNTGKKGWFGFPRIRVKDDVGHSFMTKSRWGMGIVYGNAQQYAHAESTGGIAIVYGNPEHSFGSGLDDTYAPAIAISLQGIRQTMSDNHARNGVIFSLNASKLWDEPPTEYMFRDAQMTVTKFGEKRSSGDRDHATIQEWLGNRISTYITSWIRRREKAAYRFDVE